MTRQISPRLRVRVADERSYQRLKTILSFESSVRGRTLGQTVFELVMSAIDEGSYPDEVVDRIGKLRAQTEQRAAEKALNVSYGEE